MTSETRRKEEERDKKMANMMTHVELLVKNMMDTETKSVNDIESQEVPSHEEEACYALFDEDVRYMVDQGMDSRLKNQ